jgi:hypothetical protein
MPLIDWRVRHDDVDVASVRYRCTTPAGHLRGLGFESRLSWPGVDPLREPRPDAVVFVKAFGEEELAIAERAPAAGVRVLLDVCDNLFAPDYPAAASGQDVRTFRAMAGVADSVTTTGPALAEVLRREVGELVPVHEIPDPVETRGDLRFAQRLVWRERLRNGHRARTVPRGALRDLRAAGNRLAARRRRPGGDGPPRLIWFGNVGSLRPRFGIVNLLDVADELAAAHERAPFRLVVVTGDPGEHRERLDRMPFGVELVPWHRTVLSEQLPGCAAALVPNGRDPFSVCKSANRVEVALAAGVPVVATSIPSVQPFAGCVELDDFEGGPVRYLTDRAHAEAHRRRAAELLERDYSGPAVARRWANVCI